MSSPPLYIVYYEGAYGPTIRIGAQEKEHLILLRGIILQLVNNQAEEVEMDMNHFSGIQFQGLDNLVLKVRRNSYNPPHLPGNHHSRTLIQKLFSMKTGSLKL